jgi:acetyl-CoA C-acetyltransferase
MPRTVILSAVRTAIGTAWKGSLTETPPETLAKAVVVEAVRRSGLPPGLVDDIVLAESQYGGGAIARHVAVEAGMLAVPGLAINRHCAGSLSAVGVGAASICAGIDRAIIAGGVQSSSLAPEMTHRLPGTQEVERNWFPSSHPDSPEAPNRDMTIAVGWNTARLAGVTREDMDRWAYRSHQRAIAAIDAGHFKDEILPITVTRKDGSIVTFDTDEYPRRDTSLERLASLKPLHPEIEGFSITAGNSSGINDAAAALMLASEALAGERGLKPLATVRGWATVGVDPVRMGLAVIDVIPKALSRAGVAVEDVALWEINEAFASVPVAVSRYFGLDEAIVNAAGSGCSLGHPVSASGARMLSTLIYDLRRSGGGIGVAAMCAGGGQAGAVVIEV